MGHGAEEMKYRFQWNFPIFFSPHDANKLYTCSNQLHVSTDEGQSWQTISPDLTRNDSTKLGSSGGPITKDNTSVEYYCTIFAAAESPRVAGTLWTGSDDGLVHVSQDAGKNWSNVTPAGLPEWIQINDLVADPHHDGGCYIAATMYKSGNYEPYLYRTRDYGKSWTRIDRGIDRGHFTRAIEVDPVRQGLLYAGTETGMYISYDDGIKWYPFQMNLPIVPITDLAIKDESLVASTQGRSLWLIDDLSVIRQQQSASAQKMHLYQPKLSYRMRGGSNPNSTQSGINHPSGLSMMCYVDSVAKKDTILLHILSPSGDTIRSYSNKSKKRGEKLSISTGSNKLSWDLRYPRAERFDGMILWWGSLDGPKAPPGTYTAILERGDETVASPFEIAGDPRIALSNQDYQSQFEFEKSISDKVTEAHKTIKEIRDIREQLEHYTSRLHKEEKEIISLSEKIDSSMSVVEKALYQTKNKSGQDPLNFPIRLTNKLAHLNSLSQMGDAAPTEQAITVRNEMTARIDLQLSAYESIKNEMIPRFNKLMKEREVKAIILKDSLEE